MTNPVKNLKLSYYPVGDLTQKFGENPKLYASMNMKGHNGIDIVRPHGEPMFAVEAGTIVSTKEEPTGYGKNVRLLSTDGKRLWVYGHCAENWVKVGDVVKEGQFIARMGNTGFVVSDDNGNGYWNANPYAGTHLHLGLRLTKLDKKGWSYPGSKIKITVLNSDNGYKGSVDPIPYLRDMKLKSTLTELGSKNLLMNQLSTLLKKIGL